MRIFVAAELPEPMLEALATTSAQLRGVVRGRFVGPDLFHVTLAFMGEVPGARVEEVCQAVREACAVLEAFPTSLGSLGTFGRARSAVLWQGFSSGRSEWSALAGCVRDGLRAAGFSFDQKSFLPHVTLMRRADVTSGALPMPMVAQGVVDTVTVFSSDLSGPRPRYEALEEVRLGRVVQTATQFVPSVPPAHILWQDQYAVAVDKHAGVLVHSDGTGAPTLTDSVREALVSQGVDATELQAVQRLDVPTSGIVLFSLSKRHQPAFDALVATHDMRKRYYALVDKPVPKAASDGWMIIDAPIARDRHDARRMRVGRTGKQAVTRVRVAQRLGHRTLVEAELVTGRKHQIRVHLAHVGCPLVGDTLYGGTPDAAGLMLHAHELRFMHPVTGEYHTITSELPERFGCVPTVRDASQSFARRGR